MDSILSQRGSRRSLNHPSTSSCQGSLAKPSGRSEGQLSDSPSGKLMPEEQAGPRSRGAGRRPLHGAPAPCIFHREAAHLVTAPVLSCVALGCALSHFPVQNSHTFQTHESSPRSNGHSARQETTARQPWESSPQPPPAPWHRGTRSRPRLPDRAAYPARHSASPPPALRPTLLQVPGSTRHF